jgi:hypothetical protein
MTVPVSLTFRLKNDQYIEWGPMVDGTTGITLGDGTIVPVVYLNNLAGTATLIDSTGTPVTGLNGAAFTYLTASNGIYRALVEQTFNPAPGVYTLQITFTAPGSEPRGDYYKELPMRIVIR